MRELVARAVRAAGHEVVAEAADADAAVLAAETLRIDVLVIDGRLPGDSAADTIARVRAVARETEILVLATLSERDVVRAAVAAGASGALIRPLRPGAVSDALKGLEKSGLP